MDYRQFDIEEILDLVEDYLIDSSVNSYEMKRKVAGDNAMVVCPFHNDNNPSAGIKLHGDAKGVFRCFTCGTAVPLIAYLEKVLGKEVAEKLISDNHILLTQDLTVALNFTEKKLGNNSYMLYTDTYNDYLEGRGISKSTYERFKLGYDTYSKMIVFPVFDTQDRHLFNQRRSVDTHYFLNKADSDKTKVLYGLNEVYKEMRKSRVDKLYIVESIIDALYLWENGKPTIALLGSSVSEHQIRMLNKLPVSKIILATDNDKAGNKVAYKLYQELDKSKIIYRAIMPEGFDVNDMENLSDISLSYAKDWAKTWQKEIRRNK